MKEKNVLYLKYYVYNTTFIILSANILRTNFFFDSFGFERFKAIIILDDKKTIDKILFGINNLKRGNVISLVFLKFSTINYNNLGKKIIGNFNT